MEQHTRNGGELCVNEGKKYSKYRVSLAERKEALQWLAYRYRYRDHLFRFYSTGSPYKIQYSYAAVFLFCLHNYGNIFTGTLATTFYHVWFSTAAPSKTAVLEGAVCIPVVFHT